MTDIAPHASDKVVGATVIPVNERWLQEPQAAADLRSALNWAADNPASDSNTNTLIKRLADGIE
jgi:hypothetical protein